MHFLINLVLTAILVIATTYILPRVKVRSFGTALLVAFLIGILNSTIGYLISGVLHVVLLPLWLLGLDFIIRLITYAIVLKIIDGLVGGFRIEGFGTAIWMAIILSVLTTVLSHLLSAPHYHEYALMLKYMGLKVPIYLA